MAQVLPDAACTPPMAVCAPDFALGDLLTDRRQRVLRPNEISNTMSLPSHVIEVEDERVPFTTVHAMVSSQMVKDEPKVSLLQCSCCRASHLETEPRSTTSRSAAVAVSAHHLTRPHLLLDSR